MRIGIGIGIGRWVRRAAVVCGLLSVGIPASVSAASWTAQEMPGPSGPSNAAVASVSCPSPALCMAVGTSDFGFNHIRTQLVGPIATFAERWDGSSWTVLPTPAAGTSPMLASLSCPSATFCVAVGSTHTQGRQSLEGIFSNRSSRGLVEVWDGSTWSVRPTPLGAVRGSALSGVSCVSRRFCIAVGSTGLQIAAAMLWNGSTWRRLTLPLVKWGPTLTAVSCAAARSCTAVGSYDVHETGVADLRPLAERWTGRGHWTVAKPPAERDRFHGKPYSNFTWLTAVSCPSRTACLATGLALRTQNFYPQGGFADGWDGHRWRIATAGIARDSPLDGVSCVAPGDCYAAGQYDPRTVTPPSTQRPLIAQWTAGRWSQVALPSVATMPNPVWFEGNLLVPNLFGISCVLQTGCTAVGAQPHGARSAPLAISDLPGAVAAG
jgi:hypothetical protein